METAKSKINTSAWELQGQINFAVVQPLPVPNCVYWGLSYVR